MGGRACPRVISSGESQAGGSRRTGVGDHHGSNPNLAPRSDASWDSRRCAGCGRSLFFGRSCRTRRCPSYAGIWARDVQRVLFENVGSCGRVTMTSVTAPGADVLPWGCSESHAHSGLKGCRVEAMAARRWNRRAPAKWSKMHRAACQWVVRQGFKSPLAAKVWEEQKRGVIHLHVVLRAETGEEFHVAQLYVRRLRLIAAEYEFGFVDIKLRRQDGREAAAYLSSYFVTGKGGKASIRESVLSEEVPSSMFYVARNLTEQTGCTMRSLRLRRRLWAVEQGLIHPPGYVLSWGRWCDPTTGEIWVAGCRRE